MGRWTRSPSGLGAVRRYTAAGPALSGVDRLTAAVAALPPTAQRALVEVAAREDLPLVAGVWEEDAGGCLVANVIATAAAGGADAGPRPDGTLDLRVLELLPELSSRDLNRLIVAWDEAAFSDGAGDDAALRALLRAGLARAGALGDPDPRGPVGREQPLRGEPALRR